MGFYLARKNLSQTTATDKLEKTDEILFHHTVLSKKSRAFKALRHPHECLQGPKMANSWAGMIESWWSSVALLWQCFLKVSADFLPDLILAALDRQESQGRKEGCMLITPSIAVCQATWN